MSAYFSEEPLEDENVEPSAGAKQALPSLSVAAQEQQKRQGNAFHVSAFSFPASNVQLWERTPRGPAIVVPATRQVPCVQMSESVLRDIAVQAGLAQTIAAPPSNAPFTMELRGRYTAASASEPAVLVIERVLPASRDGGAHEERSSAAAFDPVWKRWEASWPVVVPLELRSAPSDADAGAPLCVAHAQVCSMLRGVWDELLTHRGIRPAEMLPIRAVAMMRSAEASLGLHFEAVLPAAALVLTPIWPLRIMSTDASVKLIEQAANELDGATGFLTLGRTRQAIPLLPTDALAYNRPLVGVWARGMSPSDPRLRATVMRYLHCAILAPHRVEWPQVRLAKKTSRGKTLLLALFPTAPFETRCVVVASRRLSTHCAVWSHLVFSPCTPTLPLPPVLLCCSTRFFELEARSMTGVHNGKAVTAALMQLESDTSVAIDRDGAPQMRGVATVDATLAAVTSVWRRQAFAAARAAVPGGDLGANARADLAAAGTAAGAGAGEAPRAAAAGADEEHLAVNVDASVARGGGDVDASLSGAAPQPALIDITARQNENESVERLAQQMAIMQSEMQRMSRHFAELQRQHERAVAASVSAASAPTRVSFLLPLHFTRIMLTI